MAKILAVDDEPGILKLVERVMVGAGHEVAGVTRASDAIKLAEATRFDLCITDYDMPGGDGLGLLQRLRDIQPRCLRMLMSGKLDMPIVLDAVNRGEVHRVLAKPFRSEALLSTITDALTARARLEELIIGAPTTAPDKKTQRTQLEECLAGANVHMAVQPIVDARERTVVAYEALIRSRYPALPTPLAILAAAEEHDMIHELADVVAQRIISWLDKLPGTPHLFMNLHPRELSDPTKLARRLEALQPWKDRFVIEITERNYLLELDEWAQSIDMIGQMGFKLAIDDLGAGYNALAVLAEIQPHFIKVDMSIIRNVDTEPRKRRIIEMLAHFATATDARLVAEGVETPQEAEALVAAGAHLLQGYHIGKPFTG